MSRKSVKLEDVYELARGNVEMHLADSILEDGPDSVYESAYTLAFDALKDSGVEDRMARTVAQAVAMDFANP